MKRFNVSYNPFLKGMRNYHTSILDKESNEYYLKVEEYNPHTKEIKTSNEMIVKIN